MDQSNVTVLGQCGDPLPLQRQVANPYIIAAPKAEPADGGVLISVMPGQQGETTCCFHLHRKRETAFSSHLHRKRETNCHSHLHHKRKDQYVMLAFLSSHCIGTSTGENSPAAATAKRANTATATATTTGPDSITRGRSGAPAAALLTGGSPPAVTSLGSTPAVAL
ncbi:UNVERIFIED_CONTAM: hypothetical protein FKN15_037014 [Acipenser sinensis]